MRAAVWTAALLCLAGCGDDGPIRDFVPSGDTGGADAGGDTSADVDDFDAADVGDDVPVEDVGADVADAFDADAFDADAWDADAFDADAWDADAGDVGGDAGAPGVCGDGVCAPDDGLCPADCPPIEPASCDEGRAVGEPDATTSESFDITWDRVEDGYAVLDAPIVLALPDDVEAITVTVEQRDIDTSIDRVLLNDVVLGSVYEEPARTALGGEAAASTLLLPNNPLSTPVAGCLSLEVSAAGATAGTTATVTVVTRRDALGGDIAVHALVMGDTDVSDGDLEATFDVVRSVFEGADAPTLASVDVQRVDGPSVVADVGPDLNALRRRMLGDGQGLNVVFVAGFTEAGTLGFAGGIPAPPFEGTDASALVIAVDEHLDAGGTILDTQLMGETLAHEIGHQLGLFHTTEAEGTAFDPLADTPACPRSMDDGDGEMSAGECRDQDGEYLMFWVAGDGVSQTRLSPSQVDVLRANPLASRADR